MGTTRSSPTESRFTGCPPETAHNGLDLPSAGQDTPKQRPPGSCPLAAGGRGLTVAAKTSMTSASRSARGQHPAYGGLIRGLGPGRSADHGVLQRGHDLRRRVGDPFARCGERSCPRQHHRHRCQQQQRQRMAHPRTSRGSDTSAR